MLFLTLCYKQVALKSMHHRKSEWSLNKKRTHPHRTMHKLLGMSLHFKLAQNTP